MCTYTSLIAFSLWLNSRRGSWKEGSERDRDQMECMMAESWIIPGWYPQLVWMSQLQCFHGLKMLALLNFLDRQVYVHTHAFDCEKDYNDWKHLWSGAHQRYCCSEKKPSYHVVLDCSTIVTLSRLLPQRHRLQKQGGGDPRGSAEDGCWT